MSYHIYQLKPFKDQMLLRPAAWLLAHKVNANAVTWMGLIFGIMAGLCMIGKYKVLGIALIILSITADLFDGAVARLGGQENLKGKVLDAVCDRTVEIIWVGALIHLGWLPWWGWLLPLGSVSLLYMRCKAYKLGLNSSFVVITRFERMVVLLAAAIIPRVVIILPLLILVTMGTYFSCWQISVALQIQKGRMTGIGAR